MFILFQSLLIFINTCSDRNNSNKITRIIKLLLQFTNFVQSLKFIFLENKVSKKKYYSNYFFI